jgi:hypothetical protein
MNKSKTDNFEIIGGRIVWFAVHLTGIGALPIIGGSPYPGHPGSKNPSLDLLFSIVNNHYQ